VGRGGTRWATSTGALALVMAFVALLVMGGMTVADGPSLFGTPTFTPTWTPTSTPTPTPSPTPTPTWTPTPTPTLTSTPTLTPTPTSTPTPTLTPTVATPTPAPAAAHLWLEKPIGPDSEGERLPGTYFPYGSTGNGRYHLHHGVDYFNPEGTPVLAAGAGMVVVAGNDLQAVYGLKPDFYGNVVIQLLDQRFQGRPVFVLYAHLSRLTVNVGEHLEPGDVVGLVGMTGVAIGNHLHLEVRLGANEYESTRNPVLWLRPDPGQGIIAGLVIDGGGQPVAEVPVVFFRSVEPTKWWRQVQTYADREVNPDDELGENFALGYVPVGDYLVKVQIEKKSYVQPVTVNEGEIAFVEIVVEE
jgi:murein DD-endopeptidase MepM/ murein hydrolase activator NlpD